MELLKNNRPKIIRTKLLRLIGKKMITLPWGVYAAPSADIREIDVTHEFIHVVQYRELMVASLVLTIPMAFVSAWWTLLIPFVAYYLWYGIEWLVHFIRLKDPHLAYRRICFEREAYENQNDLNYLESRSWFKFIQFL